MERSKHYYDYTRNMTHEQELEYMENHCGRDCCKKSKCCCAKNLAQLDIGMDVWIDELEKEEQPTCNVENPEDCEGCGS
jgi:hypothetical protein